MSENSLIKKIKIIEIVEQTKDAKIFVFEALNWNPIYKPGQFLTLVFHTKHGEKRRSYSMSSFLLLNEDLSITVKRVENGEFSRYINRLVI